MSSKARIVVVVLVLVLIGAGFGAGWYFGQQQGRQDGFDTGVRYGEVQAAKKGPLPVRDRAHPVADLAKTDAWLSLPLVEAEVGSMGQIANRAISPCPGASKRGFSLATSLLDEEYGCSGLAEQLRLGLAVLRTYTSQVGAAEAVEEAIAVLRVERRKPVPTVSDKPVRGDADAPVTLTVFSDFQCPYCVRGEKLIQKYLASDSQIRVIMRHLPLTRIHPAAWPAAVAAESAGKQGKFWEMHDALFAIGPKTLGKGIDGDDPIPLEGPVPFEEQAQQLGLDLDRFRADMRSLEVQELVQADMDLAESLGVRGTPAFFFDGREVSGRRTPAAFAKLRRKAEAEADWRYSWGLEPPPPGAVAPEGLAPDSSDEPSE